MPSFDSLTNRESKRMMMNARNDQEMPNFDNLPSIRSSRMASE